MKKLFFLTATTIIFSIQACKKEINTAAGELAIAAKPTDKPTTTSILQWQKTYGSSSNELGFAIAKTSDGGYVLAGSTVGNNGDVSGHHGGIGADAWIIKINNSGSIAWQKCFGGTNGDYAYDIIATTDGGYIFSGATSSSDGDITGFHGATDAWIVKLSSEGTIEWQNVLGGSGEERAMSIIQTATDYMIAGYTNSTDGDVSGNHGDYDAWVIKLNSTGNVAWSRTYGGSLFDEAGFITQATDGFMISAGAKSSDGDMSGLTHRGGNDLWLLKINDNGDILWQKAYGGSGEEGSGRILTTPDGGYVLSTNTTSNNGDVSGNHGSGDAWVAKITSSGIIVWQKCFGGNDGDHANIMNVNNSGEIILVGYTFSRNGDITGYKGSEDFWTLRLKADGTKLNSSVLGGKSGDTGEDAIAISDDTYMAIGRTGSNDGDVSGNHGVSDIWVVKFKF